MPPLMKPVRLRLAALLAAATLGGSALAADVELLPAGLLTPTTKEMTKANQYKKAGPWRIGVSFGGVGNTWIVQTHGKGSEVYRVEAHADARAKTLRRFSSDSPTHLLFSSGPLTTVSVASIAEAMALAKNVFPVPGGP